MDIDLAYTLPTDWSDRLAHLRLPPEIDPFADVVRTIVRTYGDEAILLRVVQEFARYACGERDAATFAAYSVILGRLGASASDTWPIRYPLEEPSRCWERKKSIVEFGG